MATSILIPGPAPVALGAADLIAFVLLVGLLIAKETMTLVPIRQARAVGRVLDLGIVPLLVAFSATLAVRIVPALL